MKNWIVTLVVVVLAAGLIGAGTLYFQERGNLSNAQSQVTSLQATITALQGSSPAISPIVNPSALAAGNTVVDLVSKLHPSVVRIDVTGSGFQASGSGFIVNSGGYIFTNQHVIDSATSITVTVMNGQSYPATVTASDSNVDVAIIKINASNLPTVTLGTMSDIVVGEDAVAAGFPLGLDLPGPASFTRGIVSAVRTFQGTQYVQTDVTINPGSSGGCLVNLDGKVIGVTSAAVLPRGLDAEGVGLAIPVNVVQSYVQNHIK
jgi:serine protease Do